jgi:hypothetical protein
MQDDRLLQQQRCHARYGQRGAEQIEGVAEREDEGLLLHDMTDRDEGAMRRIGAIGDAVASKVLRAAPLKFCYGFSRAE